MIHSATETSAIVSQVAVVHGKFRFFVSADIDDLHSQWSWSASRIRRMELSLAKMLFGANAFEISGI
jgi:hypothetical protein